MELKDYKYVLSTHISINNFKKNIQQLLYQEHERWNKYL